MTFRKSSPPGIELGSSWTESSQDHTTLSRALIWPSQVEPH